MQIFADKERAGKSSVTLTVDNLDARLGELKAQGIKAGEPTRSDFVDRRLLWETRGREFESPRSDQCFQRLSF